MHKIEVDLEYEPSLDAEVRLTAAFEMIFAKPLDEPEPESSAIVDKN